MYVCNIYNAPYDVLVKSFVRRVSSSLWVGDFEKNVFNCFLKLLLLTMIGSSWRRCTGRLFQIVGAAKLNKLFAVSVRLLGTSRNDLSDDLSDLTETLSWRSDTRYAGSPNWWMLKVRHRYLGSQWSELSTGRMCSYFLLTETTRATAFCAICNRWKLASDVPTRELQ